MARQTAQRYLLECFNISYRFFFISFILFADYGKINNWECRNHNIISCKRSHLTGCSFDLKLIISMANNICNLHEKCVREAKSKQCRQSVPLQTSACKMVLYGYKVLFSQWEMHNAKRYDKREKKATTTHILISSNLCGIGKWNRCEAHIRCVGVYVMRMLQSADNPIAVNVMNDVVACSKNIKQFLHENIV